jgi:hypothetical protein
VHNRGSNDAKCNCVRIGYRAIRALVSRQRWPCGSIRTGHCRTTRQSGHGDGAKPGRRGVGFFRQNEPLLAMSGRSIIAHSANLKITSRSRTINQCSGGSFPCGQYRLQLHSAGPQKHSNTQCRLLRWNKSFIFLSSVRELTQSILVAGTGFEPMTFRL